MIQFLSYTTMQNNYDYLTICVNKILFLKVGNPFRFYSSHLKYFFVLGSISSFLVIFAWYYYWVNWGHIISTNFNTNNLTD